MRYLSLFSGIEAASVAWAGLGWTPLAFAEIEPFPAAVLAHHYPDVPNLGDVTKVDWHDVRKRFGRPDVVVFGSPCQSFSVAGKRLGLDDPRGNLALVALGIVDVLRPRWFIFENVPGLLSSGGGRDFGAFLGTVDELGYSASWRVLDAQYVRTHSHPRAVPQRRRRVFVVGHLGDWRRAAAVLFERESLQGYPAPRREAGKAAPTIPSRSTAGGGLGTDFDCDGGLVAGALTASDHKGVGHNRDDNVVVASCVPTMHRNDPTVETLIATARETGKGFWTEDGTASLRAEPGGMPENIVAHSLRADGFDASEDGTGRGTPLVPVPIDMRQASRGEKITNNRAHGSGGPPGHGVGEPGDPAFTVSERGQAIAFGWQNSPSQGLSDSDEITPTLDKSKTPAVAHHMAVRRLTPRECERLQGFPDDYTLIPGQARKKLEADYIQYLRATYPDMPRDEMLRLAKDGPRYKALGNSFATNVVRWIGMRIQMVESIVREQQEAA